MRKYHSLHLQDIVEAMKIARIENRADDDFVYLVPDNIVDTVRVSQAYTMRWDPKPGGYYVRHPNGHEFFWKAQPFEREFTPLEDDTRPYAQREEALTTGQPPITGYRNLSSEEVALINEGKALAQRCGEYIAKLREHLPSPPSGAASYGPDGRPTLDQRWISIGATDLQRGFMAVIRGIAQPTTF